MRGFVVEPSGRTFNFSALPVEIALEFPHAETPLMDIVYFDLETQRTLHDVGGSDRKDRMGMSLGVTYSTADSAYEIFPERRAGDLVARLRKADLVVGYNILNFDYEVLMAYTILDLRDHLPTLDLLQHVERASGHKISLEDVSQGTFGLGKTAEGLDAIRWWREGKVMEIAEYCCFDVKVTRLVHEHGERHGELFYKDSFGRKNRMEICWRRPE